MSIKKMTTEVLQRKLKTLKSNLANHPRRHIASFKDGLTGLIRKVEVELNKRGELK